MSEACVFPGQGSQSLGMLADLAAAHGKLVTDPFIEASEVLGFDLWALCQEGPEEKLNATENTQPALLAAGYSVWQVLQSIEVKPDLLAGHSLGEYTALVCSGALGFADGIALVAFRGRAMQDAVAPGTGAMAAILGLADEEVIAACEEAAAGEIVSAVNFNSPGQVVIAGNVAAVDRAIAIATGKGAKRAIKLPVSVPSHCALMNPAAERMAEQLETIEIGPPAIPVIHNVDVETHADSDGIRNALVAQLFSPVRWVDTIEHMKSRGVTRIIECGPGKVLAGLNKRIDRSLSTFAVHDSASVEALKTELGSNQDA